MREAETKYSQVRNLYLIADQDAAIEARNQYARARRLAVTKADKQRASNMLEKVSDELELVVTDLLKRAERMEQTGHDIGRQQASELKHQAERISTSERQQER